MAEGVEVSTRIDAAPARVWSLIGDPTRMGEWSPDCRQVRWVRATSAPALHARFRGHNRNGRRRWTTTGTIVSFESGLQIGWNVAVAGLPISYWGYRIEPDEDGAGCR